MLQLLVGHPLTDPTMQCCRQMRDAMAEEGEPEDSNFLRTVRRAAYGVKDHPARICDAHSLDAVKGIGPTLSKVR